MTERRLASELWLASLEGAPPERSSDRSLEIAAPRTSSITVEAIAVRLRRSANHRATMRHATSLVWQVPHHASSPLAYTMRAHPSPIALYRSEALTVYLNCVCCVSCIYCSCIYCIVAMCEFGVSRSRVAGLALSFMTPLT